ncbi:LLM class flavin-dependent oxidoreductase [Herbiconiux sp. 11R-BC]|uniref:LLM class flavin-dependent oxidoreductase n=1 Tax=Herbiconiux sp. 11R-BC TaxID=3111637 RepID=UPI003C0DB173
MRYGVVILPQDPWPEARRKWMLAEELGFDHAWTYDHLSWRSLAGEPWGATVPTLTAAAIVTSRIRLGTFVASPNFRHPVPFAKELATVDEISGGRMLLGVGSGGTGFDAYTLGQPELSPRQRHERFSEFVGALDELLRFETPGGSGIGFEGEWYRAKDARMVGAPAQSPRMPFVIAANGPKGLALVAQKGQGWVTTAGEESDAESWWRAVAGLQSRLDDAAVAAGRHPATIDRYLSLDSGQRFSFESASALEDLAGRAADLGFTDVISHWPRRDGIYAGSEDVLVEAAGRIRSL